MTAVAATDRGLARIRKRLDPSSPHPLVVGFSGGGDSLSLLTLACAFGRETGRRVVALTVDHGLNPDSPSWTLAAGAMARRLGAEWRALAWLGPKPTTGLPAAARLARHRLLAEATRSLGARVILLGHTADDLAESEWMRRQGTTALPDPREWSPSPVWPEGRGLFLLRPLLEVRRQDLRQGLSALGLSWIDDPANEDPRFSRARARTALGHVHDGGCPPAPEQSSDPGRARLAARVVCHSEGYATFDRRLVQEVPALSFRPVLGAALVSIGGAPAPPGRASLDRLMLGLEGAAPVRAHLAGVRLAADTTNVILARDARDLRRRSSPLTEGIFDNRFETAPGASVGFLAGRATRLSSTDRTRLKTVPAIARPSLPVLAPDSETPYLPAPIGTRNPPVTALAPARFAAACGLIACEAEIG